MPRKPWNWKKTPENEFTLDDFMEQMEQVRNMGPLSKSWV